MKKTILTVLSFLLFIILKAQAVTFLSLGVTILNRDEEGNDAELKRAIIREMHIQINSDQKKIQFLSKGMFSSDTFSLKKEISISKKITTPNIRKDKTTMVFLGTDESGRNCIIRLKMNKDEYKVGEGELQLEYGDRKEIYKLRTMDLNPRFLES